MQSFIGGIDFFGLIDILGAILFLTGSVILFINLVRWIKYGTREVNGGWVIAGVLMVLAGATGILLMVGPLTGTLEALQRFIGDINLSSSLVIVLTICISFAVLFIIIIVRISKYRRQRLPFKEHLHVQLHVVPSRLPSSWVGRGLRNRVLTILLLVAIIGSIGTLAYVVAKPTAGERFTEFYILDTNFPRQVMLFEEGRVIVGITNRELRNIEYRIEITIDGEMVGKVSDISINHEEKWELEVSFSPIRSGPNQKVEFVLFKEESSEPYLTLHLWIDVIGSP